MFFKKKKPSMPVEVVGITCSDYCNIYNAIVRERIEAASRQKSPDAAPSKYMQGLDFAFNALDTIKPYNIMEVK